MENQKECWFLETRASHSFDGQEFWQYRVGGRGRVDSITCRNITEDLGSTVIVYELFYILPVINLFFPFC
jgi:DNA mismatch repair ATPase MutL